MLSWQQKYSIASSLATTSNNVVRAKLPDNIETLEFFYKIEKYFKKKDGYVPKQVMNIINNKNM